MTKITWYQFSDLHFKIDDEYDRNVVLSSLWLDIERQMSIGLIPDFFLITGDLAYSGQAGEYELFHTQFLEPLLNKTSVDPSRVFIVPGNHDVDRSRINNLNPKVISELKTREAVNEFLGQPETLEMYLSPFSAYSSFIERTLPFEGKNPAYNFTKTISVSGTPIRICGINTAIRSGYSEFSNNSEQGHMIIGERQISDVVDDQPSILQILCMHHPLSWLIDQDRAVVEPIVAKNFSLVHHGHVHRPSEFYQQAGAVGNYFTFGAAACYDRRVDAEPYVNGYSIFQFDPPTSQLTLTLRKYSDAPIARWTANEDVIGEGTGGRRTFATKEILAPSKIDTELRQRSYSSLRDMYKDSGLLAPKLLSMSLKLQSIVGSNSPAIGAYHAAIIDWMNANKYHDESGLLATSIFLGEMLVSVGAICADQQPCETASNLVEKIVSLDINGTSFLELETAAPLASTLKLLLEDFKSTPFEILDVNTEFDISISVVPLLVGTSITLQENLKIAKLVVPDSATLLDDGADGSLYKPAVLKGAFSSESELILHMSCPTLGAFMKTSIVRHYIETRIELIKDVFSTIHDELAVRTYRIQYTVQPNDWKEQKFSVDPIRVIRVLMGSELYGKGSDDVWFREVLQNAIDACRMRANLKDPSLSKLPQITFSYDLSERRFTISDDGIGMTRDHIERYLCRAGKSIWRSEELAKFLTEKSKKISLGKFGVGFLSVFQVAESVEVETRFALGDSKSYSIKISNLEEPFFIKEAKGDGIGTKISIRFKRDYEPDINDIVKRFVVFEPQLVKLKSAYSSPDSLEDALTKKTQNAIYPSEKGAQIVEWEFGEIDVAEMDATIAIAIPIFHGDHRGGRGWNPEHKSPIPSKCNITVSNGGIQVLTQNSEWLGEDNENSHNDKKVSGFKGVQTILNFKNGNAPVTVARNALKLDKSTAEFVLSSITSCGIDVLADRAGRLFSEHEEYLATQKTISLFVNSSLDVVATWRRNHDAWCENEKIASTLYSILRKRGVLKVASGSDYNHIEKKEISKILNEKSNIVVCTRKRMSNKLFQMYLSKHKNMQVIEARDGVEVNILVAAGFGWRKLESDRDLWEAMDIDEDRTSSLVRHLPAEMGVVEADYFDNNGAFVMILPRKRARAENTVGYTREQVRIPLRVLLNRDHILVKAIIKNLPESGKDQSIVRTFEYFMSSVINEKAKTRRSREFDKICNELRSWSGVDSGVITELIA